MSSTKSRVLWITNMRAPYRVPVWESLVQKFDLTVGLLQLDAQVAKSRGEDWTVAGSTDRGAAIVTRELPAVRSRWSPGRLLWIRRSLALVRGHDVVVLGGWDSVAYLHLRVCCAIAGVPCVGFYESTLASNRFRRGPISWLRDIFFRSLACVVVPGSEAAVTLRRFGVGEDRIWEGFNAVDVVPLSEAAAQARQEKSSQDIASKIIVIAQLIPRKNVSSLLEALLKEGLESVRLTVVGQGPLLTELRRQVEVLGLGLRVHFAGSIRYEELPAMLAEHSTLVLPSTEEVWGLVANEALAAGLHVVVTENCGVATSIRDMRGVWLTTPDSSSLAKAVRASVNTWAGPVPSPEILMHSPEAFGEVFSSAIHFALGTAK